MIAEGTPEEVSRVSESHTARVLAPVLGSLPSPTSSAVEPAMPDLVAVSLLRQSADA